MLGVDVGVGYFERAIASLSHCQRSKQAISKYLITLMKVFMTNMTAKQYILKYLRTVKF